MASALPGIDHAHAVLKAQGQPGWLAARRAQALEAYQACGVPGRRDENWKYTDAHALAASDGVADLNASDSDEALSAVERCLHLPEARRIVLINGRLIPELSDLESSAGPGDVVVRPLPKAWDDENVQRDLSACFPLDNHPFVALNTCSFEDGLHVAVPAGAAAAPLHIISATTADAVVFGRLLIHIGRGAAATLVESHVGVGAALMNRVAEIMVTGDAHLTHLSYNGDDLGTRHVAGVQAVVGRGAVYDGFALTLGAGVARADLRVRFDGEGGKVRLNGAYAADGRRHVDTLCRIDAAVPGCEFSQMYKGVLDGRSRGVFQTRVDVGTNANKTDASQMHKALMLSPRAEVDCKPELSIYADDVRCSHGATCGDLDVDALFYLRSRGIAERETRALLVGGFLNEAVDLIEQETLRRAAGDKVHRWLAAHGDER